MRPERQAGGRRLGVKVPRGEIWQRWEWRSQGRRVGLDLGHRRARVMGHGCMVLGHIWARD